MNFPWNPILCQFHSKESSFMGYDMRSMIFYCFDTAAVTQTDNNVIYVINFFPSSPSEGM